MKKKHNPSCGSTSQCTSELFRLVPTALAAALLALGAAPVRAGVTGGEVISGSGSIEQPNGNTTNVYQHSHRLAVKWDTFNVGTNDTVNFYQPSSSSFVLNQIMDANASVIRGQINANGNVILVNANGIYFSASSQLNVGSLIASGHSLSVDDFMAGYLNFQREAGSNGSVINRGTINAATGGSVTLLGSSVENSGLIHAQAGRVNLAVGERITVDFDGDGLMRFVVDEALQENLSGLDTAILNTGSIQANGGSVLIEGRVAQDIFSRVVNNEGIIQAGRIENTGGEIRLVGSGGSDSSVVNTGQISASALDGQSNGGQITLHAEDGTLLVSGESRIEATSEHQQGGQIHLLGQQIGLSGTTQVDASGATGGGEILIGGDYQGKNTDIPNADKVIVTSDVSLNADATDNGDGGRIIVWADDWTRFAGNLSARGGDNGGDGGFAEVSGKNNLAYSGMADLRAPMGETGTLLLDPENITIVDGLADSAGQDDLLDPTPVISFDQIVDNDPDPDITNFTISNGTINAQLANVILQATNDIIQNADAAINIAETGVGITLQAGRHITLNGGITTSGGHIHLEADSPHHAGGSAGSNGTGTLTLGGSGLASNGGHITLIGNDFAINQDVNAGAGNINLARTQNAALGIGTGGSSQLSIAEFNRLESNGTITLGQARTAATDGLGESGLNNGIELLSSSITLNAALTTTASSDTILLISNGNITFGNNAVVASSSGGLTLHSLTGNISTGRAITAGDLVLNAGGDITTNSSHALAGSSILLEAGGDIGTSGARVTTSTNNLTAIAGGSAWITNTGTDATTLAGSAVGTFDVAHSGTGSSLAIGSGTNAAGSTINGINAGSVKIAVTGANNHLTVNQAIQSNAAGGHIELTSAGNITTAANLAATDGNILLTATNTTINLNSGTLTANAANRFIHLTAASIEQHAAHGGLVTQGLRLNSANAGHLNLHSNTNQIQTLAASIIGAGSNLSLNNNQALTIGTVDGLTGITTASGNLTLDVNGVLTANANITNSNSGSNIHLKASSFELLAGEISTNNGGLRMEAMSNSDGGNAINQNSGHRINTSALLLLLSGSGNNRNIHLGGTTNTIGRVAGRHTETDKSIGGITLVNSNNIEIGTITDPLTPGGLGDITGIQSQSLNITASNITLAADVTTTGTQTYTGAVTLASAATLTTTNSNITFHGTGTINGAYALTLEAGSGDASFGGIIGGTTALTSLTVTADNITLGGNVTTTGTQTYTGGVTLASAATLTTSNNDITFNGVGTINGGHTLTLAAGIGNAYFNGAVGGTTALTSLTVTAGNINLGGNITTTGTQTYTGTVTLTGTDETHILTAGAGQLISMSAGLVGGNNSLSIVDANWTLGATATALGTLTAAGTATLNGNVTTSGSQTYQNLIFNGTDLEAASLLINGSTTLGGNITTTGTQTYTGAVTLASAATLTTTNSNITFHGTGTINGAYALTLEAGSGDASFGGIIGGTTALTSLTVTADNITLGGNVTTTGTQTYTGGVTLASAATLTTSNNDITFNGVGTINGGHTLTLAAGIGNAYFNGAVGGTTALTSLTVTAGNINLGGNITTTGTQTYTGGVTLASAATLTTTNSNITFNGTGTINGAYDLNLAAGSGTAAFGGVIGGTTALTSLAVTAGNINLGGNITTTGTQTYTGGVTLASAATLTTTNSNITFNGAGTINGAYAMTLAAGSGTAAFGGVIGGTTALTSLAVTAGNITLGGNVTTTGAQTYTGPMTLTGGTGVTRSLNAGAGQITLGSVNATGESLTLQGNAILNGALTGLSELDISGTTTLNTGSITTTGNQSYNGTLTLTEATSLTSTGGDISFNGIAGATQNLTTEASSGTTFFTGDILALGVLDVTGAASLGGSITTSGSQTYQGVVTLTDATSLTTTNQNIDFQSGIQGDYALTLNTGSADILISGTSNLYSLTLTQARHVTLQDIALNEAFLQVAGTGTTAFNGDLSASTLELTTQSMQLAANKTLNSTAGNITVYSDGLLIGADASLNAGSGTVTLAPQTQTNTLQVCSTTSCSGSGFDSTYDLGTLSITAGTITVGRTSHTGNITLQSIAYGYNLTLENAAAGYIRVAGTVEGSGGFLNLNSNGGSIQLGGSITTTGNQTYSGNLSLTDTTNLNSTAGNISLNSISGGGYNLTTTTAAGFNSLFTGTTAGLGTLTVNGTAQVQDAISSNSHQNWNGAVTLTGDTSLTTTNSNITFNGAGTINGAYAMTLAAGSGTAAFGGVIGGTTALTSLAVTAGNITLGGNVTTTGAQTYTGPMTLTGGTGVTRSLNAGAGQITLGSVNATGESLTLQGNAILNGALTGLSELDISGTTTLNTGSITTTGNQSYNGTLTLTEATSLTSTGGDISFNGIAGATQNLTTEASSGTTFFTGDILALGVLDVTGAASLGGSITTSGSQTYQGVVTLTDATSLTTTNQNIDFQSGIQGDYALTLNTGSADILISGTSNLYSLTLTQARHVTLQDIALNEAFLQVAGTGTTAFNGDLSASTLELTTQSMQLAANKTLNSTAGNITVYSDGLLIGADASLNAGSGTVTLAPQTQTNTLQVCSTTSCSGSGFDSTYDLGTLSITAGTITVGRTSHTGNITLQSIAYGYNLTLENAAAGYIRVAGTVEGSGGFLNLNSNGGSIQLGGSITTTGNQTYSGNLSLTDTTNLNSTAGNISLNSISGGGYNLTTTTAAGFNSLFTGTTADLGTLTVNGTAQVQDAISSNSHQNWNGAVTLTGDTSLTSINGNISLNGVDGGGFDLTSNTSGFASTLLAGGITGLDTLTVNGRASVGGSLTTTGTQSWNNLTLTSNTSLVSSSGNILLNGLSGAGFNLTSTTDNTNFTELSGEINALNNLTVTGNTRLGGNVTTTGNQTYNGAVTLTGGSAITRTLTANGGNGSVALGSVTAAGNESLTVNGNATFNDSITDLTHLQVTGATALNTNSVTTAGNQTYGGTLTLQQTDTTLTVGNNANLNLASVNTSGTYNLTLITGTGGSFNLGSNAFIELGSGDLALSAGGTASFHQNSQITASNISLTAAALAFATGTALNADVDIALATDTFTAAGTLDVNAGTASLTAQTDTKHIYVGFDFTGLNTTGSAVYTLTPHITINASEVQIGSSSHNADITLNQLHGPTFDLNVVTSNGQTINLLGGYSSTGKLTLDAGNTGIVISSINPDAEPSGPVHPNFNSGNISVGGDLLVKSDFRMAAEGLTVESSSGNLIFERGLAANNGSTNLFDLNLVSKAGDIILDGPVSDINHLSVDAAKNAQLGTIGSLADRITGLDVIAETITLNGDIHTIDRLSLATELNFSSGTAITLSTLGELKLAVSQRGNTSSQTLDLNRLTLVADSVLLQGNGNDKLQGYDASVNTWFITGNRSGSIENAAFSTTSGPAQTATFSDFAHLQGGDGGDTFTISASHTGSLHGGNGDDQFILTGNGFVNGMINGGTGANTLDSNGTTSGVTLALNQHFSNIQTLVGGSGDVLRGNATGTSTWILDGASSGTLNGITFSDFSHLYSGSGGANTFIASTGTSYAGTLQLSGNRNSWDYVANRQLTTGQVIGSGTLTIAPAAGNTNITIGAGGLLLPNLSGHTGTLIIGGSLSNGGLPLNGSNQPTINTSTLTVNTPILTGGSLVLMAANLQLNSASIQTGGSIHLLATGNFTSYGSNATGSGDITLNQNTTIRSSSGQIIAAGGIVNANRLTLDFNGGNLELAVNSAFQETSQPNPNSNVRGIELAASTRSFIQNVLGLDLVGITVSFANPAASVLGVRAIEVIDIALFEEDLTLFGRVGEGVALAFAQCEEVEGCTPDVTVEELTASIDELQLRINQLENELENTSDPARRQVLQQLLEDYRSQQNEFLAYRNDLQDFTGFEQQFEDEFGAVGQNELDMEALEREVAMIETIYTRVRFLESLQFNRERREMFAERTGLDLSEERLSQIIDSTLRAAARTEARIERMLDGN